MCGDRCVRGMCVCEIVCVQDSVCVHCVCALRVCTVCVGGGGVCECAWTVCVRGLVCV